MLFSVVYLQKFLDMLHSFRFLILASFLFLASCQKEDPTTFVEVPESESLFLIIQNIEEDVAFDDAWILNGRRGEDTVLNIYRKLLYTSEVTVELVGKPTVVRLRIQEGMGQRECVIEIKNTYTYFDFNNLNF